MRLPQATSNASVLSVQLLAVALLLWCAPNRAQAGTVTVSPNNINFGDVKVGNQATSSVLLTNNGSSQVTISNGSVKGAGFSVRGVSLPITLNPGQSFTLPITFAPGADGTYSGNVSGWNNSGPIVNISLAGNGTASGYSVSLSWNPSTSDVVGYNVYRSMQPKGSYKRLNSALDPYTMYADDTVLTGKTYYYVTTAVDSSGHESAPSNRTQASIP